MRTTASVGQRQIQLRSNASSKRLTLSLALLVCAACVLAAPSRCAFRQGVVGPGLPTAISGTVHSRSANESENRPAKRTATPVGRLRYRIRRDHHGKPYADVYLTEYLSGKLLAAQTRRGVVRAVWRVDAPPGYVSTQYPIKIIVASPKTLPVRLNVSFGPIGFTGFGLELNGKRASFEHADSAPGGFYTMWLRGGRSVIMYGM